MGRGDGFRADANAIFAASVRFLDMKNYLGEVQGGLIGDLGSTGGMAGDDDAGHGFGRAYSPAAATAVRGIGTASAGCAAISGNLLGMAWNYLLADDAAAASLVGGRPQLNSGMAPGAQECEPSSAAVALPRVGQRHDWGVNHLIAPFWPEGDPDTLDAASATWHLAATRLGEVTQVLVAAVAAMAARCDGVAFDRFCAYADRFAGLRGQGGALLPGLARACETLSRACSSYAGQIRSRRAHVGHVAEAAGIVTVAGAVLTFFTFGISGGVAETLDAGAAADLALTAATFAEGVAADAAVEALPGIGAELEAELEKVLLSVSSVTVPLIGASLTAGGAALTGTAGTVGTAASGAAGGAGTTAILTAAGIGPIPAPVPPFSPLLTPAQLTAFNAWLAKQKTGPLKPQVPSDRAYQIAVAGPREYVLPTGTAPLGAKGSELAVDGIRPSDGALIDAKNVRRLGCTPRTLRGLQNADIATDFMAKNDADELAKYRQVLANPANSEARYLEIDTNDPEAVGYWQFLAAGKGVKTNVRYIP